MIRAIAAIDQKRGIADDHGIPWNLPSDRAYVREKTWGGSLLMGYNTYTEFNVPLPGRKNLVVTNTDLSLRPGFEPVYEIATLLQKPPENLWIFGGSSIFEQTIDSIDELYITQLKGDFGCSKFFPEYVDSFELVTHSEAMHENGIEFRYEVWQRKH